MKNFQAFICNMTLGKRIFSVTIGVLVFGIVFYLLGGKEMLFQFLGAFIVVTIIILAINSFKNR